MKVVCIADFSLHTDRAKSYGEIHPVKDAMYHVRKKIANPNVPGAYSYWLVEIVNQPRQYSHGMDEVMFGTECFRPVTDISDLIKLTKVRQLEDA